MNAKQSRIELKAIDENVLKITENMESYGAVAYLESLKRNVRLARGLKPGDYKRFIRKIDYKLKKVKKSIREPY